MKSKTLSCTKCFTELPLSSFTKDKTRSRGYRGDCNPCRNIARTRKPVRKLFELPLIPPQRVAEDVMARIQLTLPEVEMLPAAYLKRCADYWGDLVDGNNYVQRLT